MHDPDQPGNEQILLDEQVRYYRARAREYDVTSSPSDNPFSVDTDRIRAALHAFGPRGRVLELAGGTGQWTGLLAESAAELTVVDSSPEMLQLNAEKVGDPRTRYVVSDIFALPPDAAWDVVFFGFWLSHVPLGRFGAFWDLVRALLRPQGRVFFVDEGAHRLWEEDWIDAPAGIVRRRLNDGTAHRAVKVQWRADALEARLRGLGWEVPVQAAGPFLWGAGGRQSAAP